MAASAAGGDKETGRVVNGTHLGRVVANRADNDGREVDLLAVKRVLANPTLLGLDAEVGELRHEPVGHALDVLGVPGVSGCAKPARGATAPRATRATSTGSEAYVCARRAARGVSVEVWGSKK